MQAPEVSPLLARAKAGDFQAFAKFLTWLERSGPKAAFAVDELLNPPRAAFRFGITGPPGAGKSTLVGRLIADLRARGARVGVIAVDPSSPFTRGAILGDRIRYSDHFNDAGVFIRSLGTRGSLGGLSSAAFLMARAFDICAFDVVLIETVGVGQTELDVLHVADRVGVVLVPESGDSIQAMKAGLMEIADIFVINKSDRPGADGLAREIEAAVAADEAGSSAAAGVGGVKVIKAVATEGRGVRELAEFIRLEQAAAVSLTNRRDPRRLREEARALLRGEWESRLEGVLAGVNTPDDLKNLFV
jgi:LAO/AO transport system kinase